jgi:hypothetical protein
VKWVAWHGSIVLFLSVLGCLPLETCRKLVPEALGQSLRFCDHAFFFKNIALKFGFLIYRCYFCIDNRAKLIC